MYCELEGKDKKTAERGILIALVSLLFTNPDLKHDGVHPNPVDRIFKKFDLLASTDKESYSALLSYLLTAWSVYAQHPGMPKLCNYNSYSDYIVQAKTFMQNLMCRNNSLHA